ncbi:MAG: immunoglobulin domain-containing protein [Opitutaceae bacterium]|nr:immunoglobulin domain-containing protein [Verrucomicrobiales bacterium]
MGRTFADTDAKLFLTPVAVGVDGANRWIDVQVNIGSFPTNEPPTLAITAIATNVAPGVALNFQTVAVDPNGDELAYSWDFGDDSLGTIGLSSSHSWSGSGEYLVRCRVSDMKGGSACQSVIVIVGSPSTFRITGQVTQEGLPLENVRISASSTQMTYTDSQGNYSLVGLAGGSYTVSAALSGYSFSNSPSANPVTVGPASGTIDFHAFPIPASIFLPPIDQIVNAGTNALFSVVAAGSSPLSYQWLRNGTLISGATGSSYLRTNTQTTDAGSYSVVVTNSAGSITSVVATLTVIDEPIITTQPQDQLVNIGSIATFNVAASGGLPLTYQWIYGFDPIAGGTNDSLTVTNVQGTDAGVYFVLVFNTYGFTQSTPALLTVNQLPIAATPHMQRVALRGVKAQVREFIGTDSDDDVVRLYSAGPTSMNGGSINTNGAWVFYAPPAGSANSDSFPFTVSDGRGGFGLGTATVTIKIDTDTSQNLRTETLGNGSIRLIFDGIPNRTYSVQFTESLSSPQWQLLATATPNDSGTLIQVDSPPVGSPSRFYRISEP